MDIIMVLKMHENEIKEKYHVKRIGLFGSYIIMKRMKKAILTFS